MGLLSYHTLKCVGSNLTDFQGRTQLTLLLITDSITEDFLLDFNDTNFSISVLERPSIDLTSL